MEKKKILVRDDKGLFLKMFKRQLKAEFDFFENTFLYKNENEAQDFAHSVFVIYNKDEFMNFLKLDKKGINVLVCLFNKQLYDSLSFLEEVKSFILLDSSKRRVEIIKELKFNFKSKSDFVSEISEMNFRPSNVNLLQFNNFYKFLFFLT